VTRERYEELLERLLDNELPPAEATEFAEGLREQPELARDLRQHLVLWESWSQHVAAERSAEAFAAGWQTRVRAEAGAEEFSQSVLARIRAPGVIARGRLSFWKRWLRPQPVAVALLAVAFCALASWWSLDRVTQARQSRENAAFLAEVGTNQIVTITGEGVCAWCVLREGPPQRPAIRIQQPGARAKTVYLQFRGYSPALHHFFIGGTTVHAKGLLREVSGRLIFRTQSLEVNGREYR
jgi:hypothetical protein